ncbi:SDR family NAD(P)-dependent oxidoreductase [Hyphomicrobium sp.]|uniref:SDR family NAD(P)-dependent oxidoreductase n=1 Tax=Hyphomicrobium sp. TaxID=82 RepID=UPI002D783191|nr:SDR family NAD(P)-dependent oxidoreductase [Hyphomicrobium sp.]HET6390097.1 SDR family NAD(P)-dependent oxidoreductase [Hyphomicrobium sp.]
MAYAENTRTALVTGANRGIGFEIARQLAAQGFAILAGVRSREKAATVADEFKRAGADVEPVILDMANSARLPEALVELESRHAPIDVLVNNAAILIDGPGGFNSSLFELSEDVFRRTWETNVLGPMLTMRALMPGMLTRGFGRVVNMSSLAGQLSNMGKGYPAYRVSKAALNALTRIAAAEAAASDADVKVNACSPGWVRTGMGGKDAPRLPEKGAETAVWLATIDREGPNGGFFQDKEAQPW